MSIRTDDEFEIFATHKIGGRKGDGRGLNLSISIRLFAPFDSICMTWGSMKLMSRQGTYCIYVHTYFPLSARSTYIQKRRVKVLEGEDKRKLLLLNWNPMQCDDMGLLKLCLWERKERALLVRFFRGRYTLRMGSPLVIVTVK